MIASGHTAVGVIIGVTAYQFLGQENLVSELLIVGIAGVVSHYITDFLPHGHFFLPAKFKKNLLPTIVFDVFLPALLFLAVIYFKDGLGEKLLLVLFGIGGAQLPDVIDGLVYTKVLKEQGILKIENDFHQYLHWHGTGTKTLLMGFRDIWQVALVIIALLLIIFG